jgi:hypothetical protein
MQAAAAAQPTVPKRGQSEYKLKCPSCQGVLSFQEGCVKCYGCGYSQC